MDAATGRVVVVTGANEGIGLHLAAALAADGHRVAGFDVNGEGVRALAERFPDRVAYHRCDVTSDEDVRTAVDAVLDEWGRVDILVNNAAVFNFAPFEDGTLEDTRREFEVNYFGYVRTIRAVLPHMRARNAGIVHNVSSGVSLVGHPGLSGYASTKGAVEALTRSLRLELRNYDVACTVVYPPLTATRSAARIGYPDWLLTDPAEVGRKLADRIEARGPVVTTDWATRIGLAVARRFPWLVEKGTERFVASEGTTAGRTEGRSES
ncbi:SDR family NAD(P)-dependent oxidoreductase [Halosimplex marinum]|uniref:SDR family NAD(P)-dependent oxidoreductase n=1 Tax=Halosimplex marinum TaxID=3396620 RepID=UPI003F56761A